jgi:hypothetical protein
MVHRCLSCFYVTVRYGTTNYHVIGSECCRSGMFILDPESGVFSVPEPTKKREEEKNK